MPGYQHYHDTVHWNMADITSRIIAQSGIPSDMYHLGKIILQSLKDSPDMVAQIDGSTGQSETNGSVLKRSIQCAISLKKMGFKHGDIMILMAPNHLDMVVPFYAGLYLGIIIAPIDRFLAISELANMFLVTKPKLLFCQSEKVEDIRKASAKLGQKLKIITFDQGNETNFSDILEHGGIGNEVEGFCPTNFDPAESIALLISTSGTTGLPKSGAATHKNFAIMGPYIWAKTVEIPAFHRSLMLAQVQWLTAILNYICSPYQKFTRIQTPLDITQEHVYDLINKYKPSHFICTPTMMATLLKPGDRDKCDFTCFYQIMLGGCAIYSYLIEELKEISPKTEIFNTYGLSELTNLAFVNTFSSPTSSCGKPIGCLQYRLVDPETGKDVIDQPNVTGELWLKGPGLFKGYYNNLKATEESFAEGCWFKTGDLMYRDENWNFYFAERMKLLLKYKGYQISPVELEALIRQHPGVLDVAVTGIPHLECGDLPVACVVPREGHEPTAHEIKDLVKNTLTDSKQLRGGVIFLKHLPITASTKVNRRKIRDTVLTMKRE